MNLCLIPLKKELTFFLEGLKGVQKNDLGWMYKNSRGKDWQFVIGGLGKVNFALSTYKYVSALNPYEVFVVGSCGAISSDLKPLDTVEVTTVVEHDFKSSFLKPPIIKNERTLSPCSLTQVLCASGDKDVLKFEEREELKDKTQADIVTWESAGFFKAMRHFEQSYAELRVVTDLADEGGVEAFEENLKAGMQRLQKQFFELDLF